MSFPTNGGYQFRQPQFGNWTAKMAMVGEDATIKEIIQARQANAAISAKHNLSTDYETVKRELREFQEARGALPRTVAPNPFQSGSSRLPARVLAAAADVKTAARGTAVVIDWLMSGGKPVATELAVSRAKVCVACPLNSPGSWFTTAPAELLKATVETWRSVTGNKSFKFETPYDDKLQSCSACKCLLPLKVWVDSKHILGHTAPEVFSALHPSCWILSERKALTQPTA